MAKLWHDKVPYYFLQVKNAQKIMFENGQVLHSSPLFQSVMNKDITVSERSSFIGGTLGL